MHKFIPSKPVTLGLISLAVFISLMIWCGLPVFSSKNTGVMNSLGGTDSVRVLSQRANDIIYNPLDNKLYVSVPSSAGSTGNSIRRIDPMAVSVAAPIWVGSEPNRLTLSGDGQSLYVGLDGAFAARRFDTVSNTSGQQFALGFEFFAGNPNVRYGVSDISVSPTNPNVVAIARLWGSNPQNLRSTAIYTNGAALPQTSGFLQDNGSVAFASSESTLFGSGPNGGLRRMTVSETGISNVTTYSFCANARIKYDGGRIYCSTGEVVDAASAELLNTFPQSNTKAFVADGSVNRAFYLVKDQSVGTTWLLKAFDTTSYGLVGTLQFTNVAGDVTSLVRWGANGLAFATTGGKVYVIQTGLIPTQDPVPTPSETPFTTPTPTPTPIETSYRYIPTAANHAVYNADNQKLYVSLPSSAGPAGNSIGIVDPVGANLEQSIWIGSEPNKLAMSSDRQKLYVGLDGSRTVREFSLANSTVGAEYPIGIDSSNGPMAIQDMAASPDSPSIIAVARHSVPTTAHHGVALYSGGIQYPQVRGQSYSLAFSTSTSRMFGADYTSNSRLEVMTNSADGVVSVAVAPYDALGRITFANGLVYGAVGQVIDPDDYLVPGSFTLGAWGPTQPLFVVDDTIGRAFYVLNINGSFVLRAYDLVTYLPLGEVNLPGVSSPTSIRRWGSNGLAVTQSNGPITLIRSKLVNESEVVPAGTLPPSPSPTPTPDPAFVRRVMTPNTDMLFNQSDSKLYVTVPYNGAGGTANSIARVNPLNGSLESAVAIGTNPQRLALSADGGTMYVSFDSPIAVRRFDVQTQTPGLQFPVNTSGIPIVDMIVDPNSPDKVVVAARSGGTAMYHNGVMLPNRPASDPPNPFGLASLGQVRYSDSPNLLYGFDNGSSGFYLYRITADANGLASQTKVGNLLSGFYNDLQFAEGKLFSSDGRVVNPETNRILGTFGSQGKAIAVDTQLRKAFIAARGVIHVFDIDTYLRMGRILVPVASDPVRLVRWGTNGLAVNFSNGDDPSQLYILRSLAVSSSEPIPLGHGLQNSSQYVTEENTVVTVTVTRSGDLSIASTVDYATSDGTAQAGVDYGPTNGTLSFASGETSKNILVPIFEDNVYEGPETLSLALSNPTGPNAILMMPSTVNIEIGNDDFPPAIRANAASVIETRGGTTATATVSITLTNPSVQIVTVNYSTANGTATAGSDYQAANGTITFAPLETMRSIPITILGDNLIEGNETFFVNLSNPTNGAIVGGPAIVTIQDSVPERSSPFDFDGDDKTDVGIFRPAASGGEWWINRSSTGQTLALQFGAATDRITPADYTGDGKADIAFFRPSSGEWYVLRSEDFSFFAFPFGTNGDVPVPADYDADGKSDFAVFRSTNATWYISQSSGAPTRIFQFGVTGDLPVVADYDADGKADVGIFRAGAGGAEWWIERSSAGSLAMQFGANTDKAVQGDYTGDGRADIAIWRSSTGEWFVVRSEDSSFYGFPFGANGDVPAPGDYDGDGKFDATVFRPASATWFIARSTAGTQIVQFGANGDRPIPASFVP